MGYCISQVDGSFYMAAKDQPKALKGIKGLAGGGTCCRGINMADTYSWLNSDSDFLDATSFEDAIYAWRWECAKDDFGNVIALDFIGEKIGDDIILFQAIAPWVKSGSYIAIEGEDGYRWSWMFGDGKCKEVGCKNRSRQ